MKVENKKRHAIDIVFVICLLLLFMLSALAVITIGASIYKKNVEHTAISADKRISFAYVTEKVRQADQNGNIFVKELFGKNVLVLQEDIDGSLYDTYIYEYNGYMMELFARDELTDFYPQSGQKIIKIESFNIEEAPGNLLRTTITNNGGMEDVFYIAKRSRSGN